MDTALTLIMYAALGILCAATVLHSVQALALCARLLGALFLIRRPRPAASPQEPRKELIGGVEFRR